MPPQQQYNQAPQFPPPGQPVPPPNPSNHAQQPPAENTIAIVGLILAFIVPLAGLICSIIGLSKSKRMGGKNRGFAMGGIIVSILGMILFAGLVTYAVLNADEEGALDGVTTNEVDTSTNEDSSSQGSVNSGDESSNSEETDSGLQGTDRDSGETSSSNGGDSGSQETTSVGDYTISNVADLLPVCANNSFPSGVVSTSGGKKTAAFIQQEVGDEYEYSASAIASGTDLRPGYTTNEVDLVVCLEATGVESFQVPCTINDKSFELVGYEFNAVVYDLQTKEEVGSSKVSHSKKCPIFAVTTDGKDRASNIDKDSLASYINSL